MARCEKCGRYTGKNGCGKCGVIPQTITTSLSIPEAFNLLVKKKLNNVNIDLKKYDPFKHYIMVDKSHNNLTYENVSSEGKVKILNFVGISIVEVFSYGAFTKTANERDEFVMLLKDADNNSLNETKTKYVEIDISTNYNSKRVTKMCFPDINGCFYSRYYSDPSIQLFELSKEGLDSAILFLNDKWVESKKNIVDLDNLISKENKNIVKKMLSVSSGLIHKCPHCNEHVDINLYDIDYIKEAVEGSSVYEHSVEKTLEKAFKASCRYYTKSSITCPKCNKNMIDSIYDFFNIILRNHGEKIPKYCQTFYCPVCKKIEKGIISTFNNSDGRNLSINCQKGLFYFSTIVSAWTNSKLNEIVEDYVLPYKDEETTSKRRDWRGYCKTAGYNCSERNCSGCKHNHEPIVYRSTVYYDSSERSTGCNSFRGNGDGPSDCSSD